MGLGDLQLLLIGVAAQLDDLHPIQQRPGDGGGGVGRGDEHHPAQIHRHLQKMVAEGGVLLAVQHLQQSRGRVAPHIAGELVDLIQHQQGVHGAGAADGLDDAAGHSADIRLAVAADIRLVPDAAQTEPRQLPVHGLGHGDGHGGLAHTGRANQTEDLALGVGVQLVDGDELQYTLLHRFQTVVIPIQQLPRLLHIRPLTGVLVPRHLQTDVQIVADNGGLRAAKGLLGKPLHLLCQPLMYLLGQMGALDLLCVLRQLLVAVVAQLVLQDLHLLPQDHVLLHLCHPLAHLLLHLHLQRQHIHLVGQDVVDQLEPPVGPQLLQHTLAILMAQRDVLGDEVGQMPRVAAVQHRRDKIVAELWHQLLIFAEQGVGAPQHGLHPGCDLAGELLLQYLHIGL